jgi:hypothetical protein
MPFVPNALPSPYASARISTFVDAVGSSQHRESIVSDLMLHAGGRLASLDELRACKTPPSSGRWHPVSHLRVLESVKETLHGAGYRVQSEKYALARSDARFFGVLDLTTPLAQGVALSVGVRNSVDKSFPLGFAAGSRVFVCDNLAFRSELLVRRKHTIHGMRAFGTAIGSAVASLSSFQETEEHRIRLLAERELTPQQASHIILTALRRGIISSLQLPKVCQAWEEPPHEDFKPRTAWSLFNAFTEAMKERAVTAPQSFVAQTIRLNGLILPESPPDGPPCPSSGVPRPPHGFTNHVRQVRELLPQQTEVALAA